MLFKLSTFIDTYAFIKRMEMWKNRILFCYLANGKKNKINVTVENKYFFEVLQNPFIEAKIKNKECTNVFSSLIVCIALKRVSVVGF